MNFRFLCSRWEGEGLGMGLVCSYLQRACDVCEMKEKSGGGGGEGKDALHRSGGLVEKRKNME